MFLFCLQKTIKIYATAGELLTINATTTQDNLPSSFPKFSSSILAEFKSIGTFCNSSTLRDYYFHLVIFSELRTTELK